MLRARVSAVLALLTVACAAREEEGPALRFVVSAGGFVPRYGDVPMPSDAFRGDDGRLAPIPGLELALPDSTATFRAHLATLDGFGLRPLVELFVTAPLDPASVPHRSRSATAAVALVDAEPGSPTFGRGVPMEWRWDPTRLRIAGSPELGVVLEEGHTYAAIVTRELRGTDGHPLHLAPALADLADGTGVLASDRWQTTADALAALRALPALAGDRLAGLTVFHTQHATAPLVAARRLLEERARDHASALAFDHPELVFAGDAALERLLGTATRDGEGRERLGWSNPTGIAHAHVGVIATGALTATRFVRAEEGDGPDAETFEVPDPLGAPVPLAEPERLPITFVLPKAPPASAAGYPVVIVGHGLGASRHAVLTFAEPLTARGFALVAIDFDGHGSRYNPLDAKNDTAGIIAGFTGTATLADGFGDVTGPITTLGLLHGFVNLSAVRDSVRQSVLDLCQVAMLLHDPALDLSALAGAYGGAVPKLDPTHVAYLGESFGSVVGATFAAIEPSIDLFVLDVPGAGIIDLEIASSPALYGPLLLLARSVYGLEGRFDRFHPAAALAQAIIDGADPLSYAPHVLRDRFAASARGPNGPRHVVLLEVLGDEIMSNVGTRALAHALGVPVLAPLLDPLQGSGEVSSPASANLDGQTAALVEYSPATHGANWSSETGTLHYRPGFPFDGEDPFPMLPKPIDVPNPIRETFDQVGELLVTHLAGGPPVLRSTKPPVADFDADGLDDDAERALGRDPWDPAR